mmetsp:Transcript_103437/g.262686  ORF Transcript_103437/g.262686 Transcript_103437/m.262686 type:complete len:204 (+) Transcript_103437:125-736(+)
MASSESSCGWSCEEQVANRSCLRTAASRGLHGGAAASADGEPKCRCERPKVRKGLAKRLQGCTLWGTLRLLLAPARHAGEAERRHQGIAADALVRIQDLPPGGLLCHGHLRPQELQGADDARRSFLEGVGPCAQKVCNVYPRLLELSLDQPHELRNIGAQPAVGALSVDNRKGYADATCESPENLFGTCRRLVWWRRPFATAG